MLAIINVQCKCGQWIRFRIEKYGNYDKGCWKCARTVTLNFHGRAVGICEDDRHRPVNVDLIEQ